MTTELNEDERTQPSAAQVRDAQAYQERLHFLNMHAECIVQDLKKQYEFLMEDANKSEPLSRAYYYFLDRSAGIYSAIHLIEGQKHWLLPIEDTK